jgi:hypothetical protein
MTWPTELVSQTRTLHLYEGESFSVSAGETVVVVMYSRSTSATSRGTVRVESVWPTTCQTFRSSKELRLERTKVTRARAWFRDCECRPEVRVAPPKIQGLRRLSQPSKCR